MIDTMENSGDLQMRGREREREGERGGEREGVGVGRECADALGISVSSNYKNRS